MSAQDNVNPAQFPQFDPEGANFSNTAYAYEGVRNPSKAGQMHNWLTSRGGSDNSFLSNHDPEWREATMNEIKEGSLRGKFKPNKTTSPN